MDSCIFKQLLLVTKGKANKPAYETRMTTARVCNFIGDALLRCIVHYVPMLAIKDIANTFPICNPLLSYLLPTKFLVANSAGGKDDDIAESPATLLASLSSMDAEKITENTSVTSFGLDSLGGGWFPQSYLVMFPLCFIPATRYKNQLKLRFNIQVSQIELLGSMTIGMP